MAYHFLNTNDGIFLYYTENIIPIFIKFTAGDLPTMGKELRHLAVEKNVRPILSNVVFLTSLFSQDIFKDPLAIEPVPPRVSCWSGRINLITEAKYC